MKIMILNGSNRKNGATAAILNEMYLYLERYPDTEVEIIHVSDLALKYCIGCCKCYETGKCIYQDDIEKLSLKIETVDGVIFGTPTYAGNVSGQMKTIIDRGHFIIEQLLYGKYAISVVTYENYGGRDVAKTLNRLFLYAGAKISGTISARVPFQTNPLENRRFNRYVQKQAERFYRDITTERSYYFQRMKHAAIFRIGIRPFVRKKGTMYQGVLLRWKRQHLDC